MAPLNRATVDKTEGDIIYVDRLSRDELVKTHANSPFFTEREILPVDVALGDRSIGAALAGRSFDYIIASHVVEHIPDLVTWFEDLGSVLTPTGSIRLAVPDRRYTFDYLRRELKTSEILTAYALKAVSPTPLSILDQYLNSRAVDFVAAWNGPLDPASLKPVHTPEFAIEAAREAARTHIYPEVHCWTFTPQSFVDVFGDLAELGLLDFACQMVAPTEPYTFEFFVAMRRCADRAQAVDSWRSSSATFAYA